MLVEQYLTPKRPGQDVFLIPDPNLHEIISNLGNRSRRNQLDTVQIRALKRGRNFISAARRGLEISRRATVEQAIEGDQSDFKVYKVSEAAMAQYMEDQSVSLDDIFTSVEHALDALIGKHRRVLARENETKLASLFFKNVSTIYVNSNPNHSGEIFPSKFFSYF